LQLYAALLLLLDLRHSFLNYKTSHQVSRELNKG